MKRILRYLAKYKGMAILAPLFKMIEATFELLVPLVVKNLVDVGIESGDKPYILKMCLILVLFCAFGFLSAGIAQYFSAKAAVGVSKDLRRDMYAKIQRFTHSDLDTIGISNILTRMSGDVNQVQTGINITLRLLMRSPVVVFGAVIFAFTIDVGCAIIFAVVVPLLLAVVFAILLATIPLFKKVQKNLERVLRSTRQSLTGTRVIRAFCAEDEQVEDFDRENDSLFDLQKFTSKISVLMSPLTYLLINFAIIALIYTGAIRMEYGIITQGALLALYDYMSQILVELIKFANFIITMTKAIASAGRLDEFFSEGKPQKVIKAERDEKAPFITFDHVSFAYPSGGMVLRDISFTAERGETVGIIGGTGSGKTSLISLIPRFYDATEGIVKVDGLDVRAYAGESLKMRIGVVQQKAVLFAGTIRDNMRWGKEDATDEEILTAIETAQGGDIVCAKGSLDAAVTEGGKNFSGGQRQRLTIARALVRNPEILILDDSASALDYATDARLRMAIRDMQNAPTTFIVSQRTASVMHADKIIVLDDGEAVGIGTHEELLEGCPIYKEIYDSQFKGGERK
ncbi:MAG: ABC transporter ATP-binding protein [Clostridia bacterium]|nr:ABC transporter ATP-binding protein [Clostridia bacterium]